jgi:hypothetical protein
MGTVNAVLSSVWMWLAQLRPAEWIGIAGFVLAVGNLAINHRRAKREPHRQEILAVIAKMRSVCEEATDEITRHLCFQKARKPKEEIYRILQAANRELTAIRTRLPSRSESLLAGYTAWYMVATGEGFPMEKKINAFRNSDDRIQSMVRAQTTFLEQLDRLRLACLCDKTKYWS